MTATIAADLPRTVLLAASTVLAYGVARRLYLRFGQCPLLQPVFVGGALVIGLLVVVGLDFQDYQPARDLLTWPLGPATVALALPVYNRRLQVRAALLPLLTGVAAGSLATIASVLVLGALAGLATPVLQALALKSVTAAIAVELSRIHGGDSSLVAILCVVTGTLGAMLGPALLTWLGVRDAAARGVALGTISHMQGTAVGLLEHEVSGALATFGLVGSAVVTSLLAPVYFPWLLHLLGR